MTRQLRLRLRTKLVVAMAFAALVPVLIVALLATGVVLSSLEASLREDADRQLGVGLNLILRAVERLGDETIQLAESKDMPADFDGDALEAWMSREQAHVPASRLQLLGADGRVRFDRVLGGDPGRFADLGVGPGDPAIVAGQRWGRGVALVAVGDRAVVRAVSPIVDASLALRGILVLSMPLDADFADGIKGALSADVLLGGPSGQLQSTFRTSVGSRTGTLQLGIADRLAAMSGGHVIRNLDVEDRQYKIAATALLDRGGVAIGTVGVAVDRGALAATKRLAVRSLLVGGLAALAFALVLALFWSRRLGAPIAELHDGAIAVSRGDLDHRIEIPGGDELTDLARAFNQMTATLQDNQARLAARMREIVALHDAGRAVSSVIDIESVSRKIVDAVARTFDVQLAALWLVDGRGTPAGSAAGWQRGVVDEEAELRPTAARARRTDAPASFAMDEALAAAEALRPFADTVRTTRRAVRERQASLAISAGDRSPGVPVVALPLDRKARMVGVLTVARAANAREFSEADLNLLTTFADQAGAAVENALLYSEVRAASEELEKKVELRTTELTEINHELGKALDDLRETQAQLILSERMAGLGLLVAGVAHEINSPTAAIRGSIDGLTQTLVRLARHGSELASRTSPGQATTISAAIEALAPMLVERPLSTGVKARKAAREIGAALEAMPGPLVANLPLVAMELGDLGATPDEAVRLIAALGDGDARAVAPTVVAALTDQVYLQRTASTVRHAVGSIQRIVGALKRYSHLDHQAVRSEADVHEGLETTLALLHHALRDIVIERRYATLPRIPVFVDELNQVWTNLIQNAQQALTAHYPGYTAELRARIEVETSVEDAWVVVRVADNGPGVPVDVLPRIFEPFFTTKPKGEGTGLGLGIARQIVQKHGGTVGCTSAPGRTVFEVRLPVSVAPPGGP